MFQRKANNVYVPVIDKLFSLKEMKENNIFHLTKEQKGLQNFLNEHQANHINLFINEANKFTPKPFKEMYFKNKYNEYMIYQCKLCKATIVFKLTPRKQVTSIHTQYFPINHLFCEYQYFDIFSHEKLVNKFINERNDDNKTIIDILNEVSNEFTSIETITFFENMKKLNYENIVEYKLNEQNPKELQSFLICLINDKQILFIGNIFKIEHIQEENKNVCIVYAVSKQFYIYPIIIAYSQNKFESYEYVLSCLKDLLSKNDSIERNGLYFIGDKVSDTVIGNFFTDFVFLYPKSDYTSTIKLLMQQLSFDNYFEVENIDKLIKINNITIKSIEDVINVFNYYLSFRNNDQIVDDLLNILYSNIKVIEKENNMHKFEQLVKLLNQLKLNKNKTKNNIYLKFWIKFGDIEIIQSKEIMNHDQNLIELLLKLSQLTNNIFYLSTMKSKYHSYIQYEILQAEKKYQYVIDFSNFDTRIKNKSKSFIEKIDPNKLIIHCGHKGDFEIIKINETNYSIRNKDDVFMITIEGDNYENCFCSCINYEKQLICFHIEMIINTFDVIINFIDYSKSFEEETLFKNTFLMFPNEKTTFNGYDDTFSKEKKLEINYLVDFKKYYITNYDYETDEETFGIFNDNLRENQINSPILPNDNQNNTINNNFNEIITTNTSEQNDIFKFCEESNMNKLNGNVDNNEIIDLIESSEEVFDNNDIRINQPIQQTHSTMNKIINIGNTQLNKSLKTKHINCDDDSNIESIEIIDNVDELIKLYKQQTTEYENSLKNQNINDIHKEIFMEFDLKIKYEDIINEVNNHFGIRYILKFNSLQFDIKKGRGELSEMILYVIEKFFNNTKYKFKFVHSFYKDTEKLKQEIQRSNYDYVAIIQYDEIWSHFILNIINVKTKNLFIFNSKQECVPEKYSKRKKNGYAGKPQYEGFKLFNDLTCVEIPSAQQEGIINCFYFATLYLTKICQNLDLKEGENDSEQLAKIVSQENWDLNENLISEWKNFTINLMKDFIYQSKKYFIEKFSK